MRNGAFLGALELLGAALIVVGVALLSVPVALVVAGLSLVVAANAMPERVADDQVPSGTGR